MSKKVLLADDSVTIQRVVKIILADDDYALQVADNGDAAFSMAQSDRPDIVLADVYMPGKNGYELCAAIKQEPALAGVPVLLLSGTFEAFEESKALAAGADGWIAKPFESMALIEKIDGVLAGSAAPAALAETTPEPSGVQEPSAVEPDMWADLGEEAPAPESTEDFLAEASLNDTETIDEVELEADDLWDDEPLLEQEEEVPGLVGEQSVESEVQIDAPDFGEINEVDFADADLTASDAAGEAAEEEVLFLDESDLLIEDDEETEPLVETELQIEEELQIDSDTDAEEETFEFVTLEESETEAEVTAAESAADSFAMGAEGEAEPAQVEKPSGLDFAEEVSAQSDEEAVDIFPDLEVTAEPEVAAEPEIEVEPETAPEPAAIAEPAAPAAGGLNYFRSDGLISKLAEPQKEKPAPVVESAASEVGGLSYFRSEGLISKLAGTEEAETVPVVEPEAAVAGAEPVSKEAVVERVQSLSEEELTAIVEQVAGKVIERLANTMLEKIAWEVVPDLAESLIKQEISRITATQD